MDTYKIMKTEVVLVCDILQFCLEDLFKGVRRKIRRKGSVRNPWIICCDVRINRSVFYKWYRAIRDYSIQNFTSYTTTKQKNGVVKCYNVKINHFGSFLFHLGKAAGVNDRSFSNKIFFGEMGRAGNRKSFGRRKPSSHIKL